MGTVEQEGVCLARVSRCSSARCVLYARLLRPCRRERPLEAGGAVGHGRGLRFSVPFLGMLQRFPVALSHRIKLPRFRRNCSPFTSWSASPFPPLPFPLLHPDKWLPGPTGFPGGPISPSRLQASAPPPRTPLRVLTPWAPIQAGSGTPPHTVASLHSRESEIKPHLVLFLPTQGRKHTSGIFSLCTRAVRSGSDLRIRAVSLLFSFFFSAPEVAFLTSKCSALGGVQAWKAEGNFNYIKLQL